MKTLRNARAGFGLIESLIGFAMLGIVVAEIASFMRSTQFANQELVQDLDVELFKAQVFNTLISTTFTEKVLLHADQSQISFKPSNEGALKTPVAIEKFSALNGELSASADLGSLLSSGPSSGLKLKSMNITSSFSAGSQTIGSVGYFRYVIDITFNLERTGGRSNTSAINPWVVTVPILVTKDTNRFIEFSGFGSNGQLTGDVLTGTAADITQKGTVGSACIYNGTNYIRIDPTEVRLDDTKDYKFCGLRGQGIDPIIGQTSNPVELFQYSIYKKADGFFWVSIIGHLTEGPSEPGPGFITNPYAFGKCNIGIEHVDLYYTCVK